MLIDDGTLVRQDGRGSPPSDLSAGHGPAVDPGAARRAPRPTLADERSVLEAAVGRSARSSSPARSAELAPPKTRAQRVPRT